MMLFLCEKKFCGISCDTVTFDRDVNAMHKTVYCACVQMFLGFTHQYVLLVLLTVFVLCFVQISATQEVPVQDCE